MCFSGLTVIYFLVQSASNAIDRSTFPTQLYPNGRPVFDSSFDPRKPEVQQYLADVCHKFINGTGLEWRGTASGKKEGINWCVCVCVCV